MFYAIWQIALDRTYVRLEVNLQIVIYIHDPQIASACSEMWISHMNRVYYRPHGQLSS